MASSGVVGFKRQRGGGEDPTTTTNNNNNPKISPFLLDLKCFGSNDIYEITKGNPRFTRGAFGEISIAIRQEESSSTKCELVAIKTIERAAIVLSDGNKQIDPAVFNELCALQHLAPHPNIICLKALYPSKFSPSTGLCLAFPYSPIDLQLTLEWRKNTFQPPLPFGVIQSIAGDIFTALEHCHSRGVIHRDIKPGNLLVSGSGTIQLCDFGLAKPITDKDKSILQPVPSEGGGTGTKGLCTLWYRPPEILLGGSASNPTIDIWSAGCVIVELTTGGDALFQGQNVLDQLSQIFQGLGTPTDSTWPTVTELPDYGKLTFLCRQSKSWEELAPRVVEYGSTFTDFLSQCVVLDPHQRFTSSEALKHEWLLSLSAGDDKKEEEATSSRSLELQKALIPSTLQEPILLEPKNQTVASKVALDLAATRRDFLRNCVKQNDQVLWNSVDESTKKVLSQLQQSP